MNVTEMLAALDDHGTSLTAEEAQWIRDALSEFQQVAWVFENLGALSIDLPGHGKIQQAIEGWADFRQLMNVVPIQPPTARPIKK